MSISKDQLENRHDDALTAAETKSCKERFEQIPQHLRINILYQDNDVIVIDKPPNLRSVPGHANPPPDGALRIKKRKRIEDEPLNNIDDEETKNNGENDITAVETKKCRMTSQEAWKMAIQSFAETNSSSLESNDNVVAKILYKIATTEKIRDFVPRKLKVFKRFIDRNQKHIFPDQMITKSGASDIDKIVEDMYQAIQERQRPLMNLPESTLHEESAFGQLLLLNNEAESNASNQVLSKKLFVVHRLDCQTSGVMVFARTEVAAASLSLAWRERDNVSKVYLAKVKDWPPFHQERLQQGKIRTSLKPSTERLKWQVCKDSDEDAKDSITLWKVKSVESDAVILELQPITGRTHQLRIHCAYIGNGIIGDTLYGEEKAKYSHNSNDGNILHLHAHKLTFPHPTTKEAHEYSSAPSW